jgi:hypothetical protein
MCRNRDDIAAEEKEPGRNIIFTFVPITGLVQLFDGSEPYSTRLAC